MAPRMPVAAPIPTRACAGPTGTLAFTWVLPPPKRDPRRLAAAAPAPAPSILVRPITRAAAAASVIAAASAPALSVASAILAAAPSILVSMALRSVADFAVMLVIRRSMPARLFAMPLNRTAAKPSIFFSAADDAVSIATMRRSMAVSVAADSSWTRKIAPTAYDSSIGYLTGLSSDTAILASSLAKIGCVIATARASTTRGGIFGVPNSW